MNILVIRTMQQGGAGIASTRFADWLKVYGHEVDIFDESKLSSSRRQWQMIDKKLNKLVRLFLPTGNIPTLLNLTFIGNYRTVKLLVDQNKYDLIVVHWFHAGLLTFRQVCKLGLKNRLAIFAHDENILSAGYGYEIKKNLEFSFLHEICISCIKMYRLKLSQKFDFEVWTPSNWLLMKFLYNGYPQHRLKHVLNYGPLFLPVKAAEREIDILFIADNLNDFRKGSEFTRSLIESLMPEFRICTIGNTLSHFSGLTQLGRLGNSQVLEVLSKSKFLIVTSVLDNYPNVIGEALSVGTNVICLQNSGFVEIALKHNSVKTFELNDMADINSYLKERINSHMSVYDYSFFKTDDLE